MASRQTLGFYPEWPNEVQVQPSQNVSEEQVILKLEAVWLLKANLLRSYLDKPGIICE